MLLIIRKKGIQREEERERDNKEMAHDDENGEVESHTRAERKYKKSGRMKRSVTRFEEEDETTGWNSVMSASTSS